MDSWWQGSTRIASLVGLRISFGGMMVLAILRFLLKGWVHALYVDPVFHFTYFGFGWVKPLSAEGMYAVFAVLLVCASLITVGLFYRWAALLFFLLFTYVELIDVATYLNHYYLVSLLALLLCFVPAHRSFSLDVHWRKLPAVVEVPLVWLRAVQVQLALVYFFAGIAKINGDWLLQAQPLRIWLHARSDLPVIGPLLQQELIAFVASWTAMVFDTTIAFFLFWRRTRTAAYIVALIFHLLTAVLFPGIGMFPFIMAVAALVFLPPGWQEWALRWIGWVPSAGALVEEKFRRTRFIIGLWFAVQVLVPLRYLCYPGKLFCNEEGYRFSWRVMLMEKAGAVFFTLRDPATGLVYSVNNRHYLTALQENQMSTQPDLILQFAHHLRDHNLQAIVRPAVFADAHVTVNGHGSRPFVDPTVDLAMQRDGFAHKTWVRDE